MDRVTILIPTYNRARFIHEALDSCFSQTYKNFQIIIYDDGSTDNTYLVVEKFMHRFKNIKYIKSGQNLGVGHGRQVLLDNLETEFGTWLDSDDLMAENRLELCLSYMDSNPGADIVYSYIQRFHNTNSPKSIIEIETSRYSKHDYGSLNGNTACATAFFRSKLKKFEFTDGLRYGSEDVLWLWYLLNNDIKVGQISEPIYLYRSHSERIGVIKRLAGNEKQKDIEDYIVSKKIEEYAKRKPSK